MFTFINLEKHTQFWAYNVHPRLHLKNETWIRTGTWNFEESHSHENLEPSDWARKEENLKE